MRFAVLAALLLGCSPGVRPPDPTESPAPDRAVPAWALPPPDERALIDRLRRECRDYDAAIVAVTTGRFLDARAAYRQAETAVRARRVATHEDKTSDKPPAGCFEDGRQVFSTTWFEMGCTLEAGLAAANADQRFEAYFKVATSDTPLSEEARRRIGTAGLDHWLAQTRERCDDFRGASVACLWPLRRLETIAPESNQAKQAAAVVADTRRLDVEMAPRIRRANALLDARGRACRQLNGSQCQWGYKNPDPLGREKLPKYGNMRPGEERQPGLFEWLDANCKLDLADDDDDHEENPGCTDRHLILPRHVCPSYWDSSPTTQKLDQRWEALLREVPDGARKKYLREQWIQSAHNCADGGLAMPVGATK